MLRPLGKKLFLALGLLILSGCPEKSQPPVVEVCITSPSSGADCVEHDGSKLFRAPSQMANYWCTNQADEAAYAAWATGASDEQVQDAMNQIQKKIY